MKDTTGFDPKDYEVMIASDISDRDGVGVEIYKARIPMEFVDYRD